jgi:hypothetical protein
LSTQTIPVSPVTPQLTRVEELLAKREADEITEAETQEAWVLVAQLRADGVISQEEYRKFMYRLTGAEATVAKPPDLPRPPIAAIVVAEDDRAFYVQAIPATPARQAASLRLVRPTRTGRRTTASRRATSPRRRATAETRDDGGGSDPPGASDLAALLARVEALAAELDALKGGSGRSTVTVEKRLRSLEGQVGDLWDLIESLMERAS